MPRYKIEKSTIVVTGAASGIGAALARQLSLCGAHLALVDRDPVGLDAIREQVVLNGGSASLHVADLADVKAVSDLGDEVLRTHQEIGGLINNAGVAMFGDFEQITATDFDWLMRINFHAPVQLTRMFLPRLQRASESVIVNMSSVFGIVAPAGQSAYSSSKFALRGFSEALMHELAGSSVRIVTVHPGGVRTSIVENARIAEPFSTARATKLAYQFGRVAPTSADQAAKKIVGAMTSGKSRLLIGPDAKLLDLIQRIAPLGYWRLVRRLLDSAAPNRSGVPTA
jgi:short-subunit dehydrogenase